MRRLAGSIVRERQRAPQCAELSPALMGHHMNQNARSNHLHPLLAALVAGFAVLAAPAWGQVLDEDTKLLPDDGGENTFFGYSIAINNGIVAVGTPWDGENGPLAGSAYLFDAASGVQLAKLLASDGAFLDSLGWSIAIDDGVVAVGAFKDVDNGISSGSVYLFDASTHAQIAKLLPNDGANGDEFGWSVAIDNGIVVVGAQGDDDNGTDAGSAYLFDAATGTQITKLLPSDGAAEERFGSSISIHNGVVAVGAWGDDDNGAYSGSAYLFDAPTGAPIAKLLPDDGEAGDRFGYSVAVGSGVVVVGASDDGGLAGSAYFFDAATGVQITKFLPNDGASGDRFGGSIAIGNGTVAVGAWGSDDNGASSGAAYLFDASNGNQIAKLRPTDGASGDAFGLAIAIDDALGVVAVGAYLDDDNGTDAGAAYVFGADADGDSLYDYWEINGIDVNGDGVIDLDLPALGADPQHKDIFLEIDAMHDRIPHPGAIWTVKQAFNDAPVSNPDGTTGITLHAATDEWELPFGDYPNGFNDFDWDKTFHFGTIDDRADPNKVHILAAKRLVYRYCIFANTHSGGTASGMAELGGNDLMVTLGSRPVVGGTHDQQAGTLMHELGHTLNLRHGGGDSINFKPNYYSVMSYSWQTPKRGYRSSWRLDYSHEALPTLDESALSEPDGLGANHPNVFAPYSSGADRLLARMAPGTWVDWDFDNGVDQNPVAVDINYIYQDPPDWPPSPGQPLIGHNDWANIQYNFRNTASFADGVHIIPDGEITLEIEQALDDLFPPECAADINFDGAVDTLDFLAFLNAWTAREPLADWNDDGAIDTLDFLAYLNAWVAGCP
jgi:hypothetical protein